MLRRLELPGYPDSDYLITATLVGGVFCHAALARVIDEQGLGPGVVIMFLCTALGDLPQTAQQSPVLPSLVGVLVAAIVVVLISRPRQTTAPQVPALPAGLVPAFMASYTFVFLDPLWNSRTLPTLAEDFANRLGGSFVSTGGFELHMVLVDTAAAALVILVTAVLVSRMVVRPRALATLWAKVTGTGDADAWLRKLRPALSLGLALTVGLSLAVSLLDRGANYMKSSAMLASAGALAAAAVLDAIDDARANTGDWVVWVDTRFAWVAPIREALTRAGVESTVLGTASSALLPLNGPLFATKILVRPNDAERAAGIIEDTLTEGSGVVAAPSGGPPAADAPALPKRALVATFVAVLLGAAMIAWPTAQAIRDQLAPPPPGEAATLAFLAADDVSDPLARWGSGNFTPPEGVEMILENVPLGERMGTAVRAFAIARARGSETHAQAGNRLLEFLATVDIPGSRRWALEALPLEADEKPGWRSFLLKTDGIPLTHDDLRAVEAVPDAQDPQRWQLHLELTTRGGRVFEELTAANVKRRFAILVNDRIVSAPVINQRISGGSAVITMGASSPDSKADAFALRDALKRSIGQR